MIHTVCMNMHQHISERDSQIHFHKIYSMTYNCHNSSIIKDIWKVVKDLTEIHWLPDENTVEKRRWSNGQEDRSQISFGWENRPSQMSSVPSEESRSRWTLKISPISIWSNNAQSELRKTIWNLKLKSGTNLVFFFETESTRNETGVICVRFHICNASSLQLAETH